MIIGFLASLISKVSLPPYYNKKQEQIKSPSKYWRLTLSLSKIMLFKKLMIQVKVA
jgi:hypothetical protein